MTSAPIGGYEDWPAAVRSTESFCGPDDMTTALARVLGLRRPASPEVEQQTPVTRDGVEIVPLRWSVGYGPPTHAWLVRPTGASEPLPGVLGLHCHGGVRSVGGEQLVDLGPDASPAARRLRELHYDGRAPADDLARRGCVVLVHDAFSWGSRRFDLSRPSPRMAELAAAQEALWRERRISPSADERFDALSGLHEDTVAKAAGALGQTFAGAVLADDLVALDVLARSPGVDPARLGCFGFSGGGGRSLLLAALDRRIETAVVSCMMATYASLVPAELDTHSWLLHVPGLWSLLDWPDLTTLGRARFLVQYRAGDSLFPADGMRAAHRHLADVHRGSGRYAARFHPGGHAFDAAMQTEAWDFLTARPPAG